MKPGSQTNDHTKQRQAGRAPGSPVSGRPPPLPPAPTAHCCSAKRFFRLGRLYELTSRHNDEFAGHSAAEDGAVQLLLFPSCRPSQQQEGQQHSLAKRHGARQVFTSSKRLKRSNQLPPAAGHVCRPLGACCGSASATCFALQVQINYSLSRCNYLSVDQPAAVPPSSGRHCAALAAAAAAASPAGSPACAPSFTTSPTMGYFE